MIRLFIDLSRYILIGNALLYCLINLYLLFASPARKHHIALFFQAVFIFLNHITCSFVLMSTRISLDYLIFPLIQMIVLLAFLIILHTIYPTANRMLTNDLIFLLSIGMILLTRLSYAKANRQFLVVCIGFVLSLFVPLLVKRASLIFHARFIFAVIGILLLGMVVIMGDKVNGSLLTLTIGPVTFQPSEFVKLSFVIFLAACLQKASKWYQYIAVAFLAACHVGLLALTKDLGSAFIFYVSFVLIFYLATRKKRVLFLGLFGAAGASVLAYFMFPHVKVRLDIWLNPWKDMNGKGYQTTQSLFAICTGNFFGFGLDQGVPESIPYVDQDFIFATICEELGVIFGICLVLICTHFFVICIRIARRSESMFLYLCSAGFGILYATQVIMTIGGNINFIPMTGVTLPFISYGGSSLLSCMLLFSIVQGISINQPCNLQEEKAKVKHKEIPFWLQERMPSLRVISAGMSFITVGMCVFLGYFVYANRDVVVNNSYNVKRQEIIANQITKGDIVSCDGQVLAGTKSGSDGEYRYYPFKEMFSHAVGYDKLGGYGIEKDFQVALMTSSVSMNQWIQDDLNGEKHPGDTLRLTLDSRVQKTAYDALGLYEGAIIVMNPKTGEILAMVSKPDFDPNTIEENWENYIQNTNDSSLVNRATNGLYPPGSTFKILTALEFLNEGHDPSSYSYTCNGSYTDKNNSIRCFHGTRHGKVDFTTSFAKSCNSSFANIGMSLDFESFSDFLQSMYFGKALNLEFPTKISTFSDNASVHNVLQTSIGQGETLVTPIHMAMITAAIANDGKMPKPYLVSEISNAEGVVQKQVKPSSMGQVMTTQQASMLQELMKEVVQSGTASRLKDADFKVAGKTGSAEFKNNSTASHAWFTCFTYDTSYPLVCTVIMEDAGSGGEYAVPIVRQILEVYYHEIVKEQ